MEGWEEDTVLVLWKWHIYWKLSIKALESITEQLEQNQKIVDSYQHEDINTDIFTSKPT